MVTGEFPAQMTNNTENDDVIMINSNPIVSTVPADGLALRRAR